MGFSAPPVPGTQKKGRQSWPERHPFLLTSQRWLLGHGFGLQGWTTSSKASPTGLGPENAETQGL